jgi:transposase
MDRTKNRTKSRPPYPRQFREEAIRLAQESGKTRVQIARDLGISEQSLYTWLKQADLDSGKRSDGLTTAEREELRHLRHENRILRQEREILKKAAAFFAKETRSTP